MGVEISLRTFLTFFSHFFYKDGLLDFWNLWKWNRYVSLELMGVEISLRTFLTFFSYFFIRTASWTSGTFGNGPSKQVDVLMGVGFSKNIFNILFFFFYRDGLLDFWNLWKWTQ